MEPATVQLQAADPRRETTASRLRETAPPLKPVSLTENQLKVIADKYLRDDPSVEVWLWRIAENIALAELLYDPLVPRQDILAGVSHELREVDVGGGQKTELLLLHKGLDEHNARLANHRRFIGNLYQLAREHPHAQAVVREWALRFYELMAGWDFLPNSPCLMNAGRDLQQLSACFTAGQPIVTSDGLKPIEQVKPGDMVLTAAGTFGTVTATMQRLADSHRKISVWKLPNETLSVTDEHPVLALNEAGTAAVWTRAGTLKEGDYVALSFLRDVQDLEEISVMEFLDDRFEVVDGKARRPNRDHRWPPRSRQTKPVKSSVKIDADLLRLFGYYISRGAATDHAVRFTFNPGEEAYLADVGDLMQRKFGVTARVETSSVGNRSSLRFRSRSVARFFDSLFGHGFHDKRVPAWLLQLPVEKQRGFLAGVWGGDPINRHTTNMALTLYNSNLVHAVWTMLARAGTIANFRHAKISLGTTNPSTCVAPLTDCEDLAVEAFSGRQLHPATQLQLQRQMVRVVGGRYFVPIRKVEVVHEPTTVYNFEVAGEHTYVANCVAVHNCYVLPIEDSIEGWGETLKNTLLIHQSGGGTGFSGCRVRPKGDIVKSTKGVASGALSPFFMIDNTTQHVKQGGTRRGANMGILPYWHPDIFDFIDAKQTEGRLENFNISIAVDSAFMEAVRKDSEIDLVNPRTGQPVRKVGAKEMFDKIVENAWRTGDPGIIFLDRINNSASNPTPHLGQIESTNPCGEQPLLPHEACNLGSINLRNFVKDGQVDWARLGSVVRTAYRFMDDVIDVNNYPIPEIEAMAKGNRRTGLGVMGWAEMLALLGIPYDSEAALAKAADVARFISETCLEVSCQLATERGVFPNFKGSVYDTEGPNYRSWARGRPRNCARTTIAPTGTISIAAGLQGSGIEPFFSIVYVRYNARAIDAIKKGEKPAESDVFYEINPIFRQVAEANGYWGLAPAELWAKIDANHKSVRGIKEVPEHVQRVFATSHDIAVPWHVRAQAAWQSYTDNAVSKTINMPNSATLEDVRQTYLLAWETGCKGITVYRDGSRSQQPLNLAPKKEERREVKPQTDLSGRIVPRPRPAELVGRTVGVPTPAGKMYVTVNEAGGRPFELFALIGKAGSDITAMTESLARLISLCLRCGISVDHIVDQLQGIGGAHSVGFGPSKVRSVPDAMGQVLAGRYLNGSKADGGAGQPNGGELVPSLPQPLATIEPVTPLTAFARPQKFDLCPSCGNSTVVRAEGCTKCQACGWGEC